MVVYFCIVVVTTCLYHNGNLHTQEQTLKSIHWLFLNRQYNKNELVALVKNLSSLCNIEVMQERFMYIYTDVYVYTNVYNFKKRCMTCILDTYTRGYIYMLYIPCILDNHAWVYILYILDSYMNETSIYHLYSYTSASEKQSWP